MLKIDSKIHVLQIFYPLSVLFITQFTDIAYKHISQFYRPSNFTCKTIMLLLKLPIILVEYAF